jgi:hypothetical protein
MENVDGQNCLGWKFLYSAESDGQGMEKEWIQATEKDG